MEQTLSLIQELVDCMTGMEVHLLPDTPEGVRQMLDHVFRELVPLDRSERNLLRNFNVLDPGCIYELDSIMGLQYALYRHGPTGQVLALGPCRMETYTEAAGSRYLRQHQVPEARIRNLLAFCAQQPVVPYERFHRLAALLARQLSQTPGPIPCRRLQIQLSQADHEAIMAMEGFPDLDDVRRVESRYEASAALNEAVKQGNLSLAYRLIRGMSTMPKDLVRTQDTKRNAQNLCIILNTQLRHAMEEIHIPPYRLDQVSGAIARRIEQLPSVNAAQHYMTDVIRLYCELAQERDQQSLSAFARLAVTYIRTHLSDNLTVKEAAKALLVNPDYLSAQFHREMGITFICYVNQRRTEQAAALLKRTDMQIQQVASAVGYNNTSYFAKQFLRYQGMTPRKYRDSSRV